jgi:TolB-like protein/Flp pilus assembly protein TadD
MAHPPTGTVTFLFTDIEGSSRLWDAQPAAMRTALAHHDAHLRRAIESHGGHVFKTVGDAFCAAFAAAPDALAAALDAQRALATERWPDGVAIKARIALNTGAVEFRDGDYFGPTLNRVARLLAIGHGGQTLMTQATHDLARDHLPPGVDMRALGEHLLKDLPRPEHVFQLCHPALAQLYPPLRTGVEAHDKETPSIAVLPFVNMSKDEENEYFADGLSEELLNVLAKIKGLRVASRTSAFHFKGKDVDIPTVARKLNVATVLEGSVRKSGNRVRITAQLIEAASDSHLWTETYDRTLDDIFAVQDDIAQSVVKEMRAALLGESIDAKASAAAKAAVAHASAGRTEDAEAYRLYLQGRHQIDRMTKESIARGVEMLEQAVGRDPSFALGWVGLAIGYERQAGYGYRPVVEGYEKARRAAQRALALEPDLPEAHVELGSVMRLHDFDWKGADAQFERALALAPGNAHVLRTAAFQAVGRGRADEACELAKRVTELDPLSVSAWRTRALVHYFARRMDEAASAAKTAIDLDPHAGLGYCYLSVILTLLGRPEEALEVAAREVGPDFRAVALAIAHHALGDREASQAAVDELIAGFAGTAGFQIAESMAFRGEIDEAFAWLERAYADRDPGLSNTAMDPLFDSLHGDPRWAAFLRKMDLA